MKAIKENKVYHVDEKTKDTYLVQGYDIYDDKGKLVEKSNKSAVSYEAYAKLEAEIKRLKAENKELKEQVKVDVPVSKD